MPPPASASCPVKSVAVLPTRLASSPASEERLVDKIRAEFKRYCRVGCDSITADDLASRWIAMSENPDDDHFSVSRLRVEERDTISLRARQFFEHMELKGESSISIEDWEHFVLLARCGIVTAQVNGMLQSALMRRPTILREFLSVFQKADTNKSGVLTLNDIVNMYSQHCWNFNAVDNHRPLSRDELMSGDPKQFAEDIIKVMDVNGDGCINYAEFTAFVLGRSKEEVTLHVYDITQGMAESITPYLVGQGLKGIWHTGVVVFGKEYFFSSNTMTDKPGNTAFGAPARVIPMGWTLWREDEVDTFVCVDLKPRFQRSTYDVVTCNCNHFTDQLLMYLNGTHPPEEIMRQPEVLLSSPLVRILRPLMNNYLRERVVSREQPDVVTHERRLQPGDQLLPGTAVAVHCDDRQRQPILGIVCKEPEGHAVGVVTEPDAISWRCACATRTARNGIWVRYFDIDPAELKPGRLRVELIPQEKISVPPIGQLPHGTDIFSV